MMRGAILALLTLLVGCSAQDAALDLELVQDLNLNTTEQLAASVDTIRLIVDSDEGLYTSDEAQVGNGFRIENVDTDAAYELVIEASVPANELPRVRLERGGLPIGPLDIRLEGVGEGGNVFATGGISRVSFVDETTSTLPWVLMLHMTNLSRPQSGKLCSSRFLFLQTRRRVTLCWLPRPKA